VAGPVRSNHQWPALRRGTTHGRAANCVESAWPRQLRVAVPGFAGIGIDDGGLAVAVSEPRFDDQRSDKAGAYS